jgi:tetratricopeptide (TPR) repeat protein
VAQGHSLQAGLAQPMATGKDTYIAFSTSPNHVANDNPDGRNSWFTEALADSIVQPGLTLDDVFIRVRMKVENATHGAQTPWSTTSLTSKFYFHPPANLEALTDASMSGKWLEEALKQESRGNWEDAIASFNRILKQAPGTSAERAAREELPYALARQEAAARIDANEFAQAAQKFEEAFRISPFAFDSGLAAANSYLLND